MERGQGRRRRTGRGSVHGSRRRGENSEDRGQPCAASRRARVLPDELDHTPVGNVSGASFLSAPPTISGSRARDSSTNIRAS